MPRRFGEKLRYARQTRGLSQSELARRLQLTQHSFVAHIEAGRRIPSLQIIVLLAQLLEVSTTYLLQDDVAPEPLLAGSSSGVAVPFSTEMLGKNIRFLRVSQGMTQQELTRRLELHSQGYLSHIEAGKKEPSPEVLLMMANVLGVSTDELLFGTFDRSDV